MKKFAACVLSVCALFSLLVVPSFAAQFKANAHITGNKVNVRTAPNTSSKVVKQLNSGHPVLIIKSSGNWYFIQTASGTKGWVNKGFVQRGENKKVEPISVSLNNSPGAEEVRNLKRSTLDEIMGRNRSNNVVKDLISKAEKGDSEAQFNLGIAYLDGELGLERDEKRGMEWLQKSAEQGYVSAQANLGVYYFQGEHVQKNDEQAFFWTQKAAEQGDMRSQHNLGFFYLKGIVVSRDNSQAIEWFRKAARQGHKKSQDALRKANISW